MLIVYASDLENSSIGEEFERYKKIDEEWNKNPAIHVMCIIGKGYIFTKFARRNSDNKDVLLWKYVDAQLNYFEMACCIGGMINTMTGQIVGSYLFDESNIKILEEIEI